jgi:predicted GNAT family acetyltransferase
MELVRFADPAAYYQHAQAFLLAHEAQHCLPIGICTTLMAQPEYAREPPYLAVVQHGDHVVAAALRTPPHNVVLSLIADEILPQAVELLARDLNETYDTLPGVIGPSNFSRAFAEHWHTVTGQAYRLGTQERVYQLEHVRQVTGVSGSMRRAADADRALLAGYFDAFVREAIPNATRSEDPPEAWADQALAAPAQLRGVYLWENGEVVSLAGYSGPTPHGMRIGPVYTPTEQRGKGFASALTASVSQMLLDGGRRSVFLFTNLANPTSNHIYRQIGYEPVGDVDLYEFLS